MVILSFWDLYTSVATSGLPYLKMDLGGDPWEGLTSFFVTDCCQEYHLSTCMYQIHPLMSEAVKIIIVLDFVN